MDPASPERSRSCETLADDEKAVQNTKRERWDGEEIRCSNGTRDGF